MNGTTLPLLLLTKYPSQSFHPRSPLQAQLMEVADRLRLLSAAEDFPIPPGKRFSYGTAGFRYEASQLASTVFRCGILAALRSLCTGATTGVMVTASHNPVSDNGVKLVDSDGGMLSQHWEPLADSLVNAHSSDMLVQVVQNIVKEEGMCRRDYSGKVILGRDTRPTGESLLDVARQGVETIGAIAMLMGIVTTPQLHWMVHMTNKDFAYGESEYYAQLSNGFMRLVHLKPSIFEESMGQRYHQGLIVDGSNGVGASKLLLLQKAVGNLNLEIRNFGDSGLLNDHVGADFVQKEKLWPSGFDSKRDVDKRCASIDGDSDRLVYFYFNPMSGRDTQHIKLLDGDKIMALFALFITQQLQDLSRAAATMTEKGHQDEASCNKYFINNYGNVDFGLVQTAYANGASTNFLVKSLGLKVVRTPTGVKYLHKKALEYDIGVYFEANGHGTILMSKKILLWLREQFIDDDGKTFEERGFGKVQWQAGQRLLAISEVVNQAVGDAFSGILLVEAILQYMNWSIRDWDAIYSDMPSRQLKVQVSDRGIIRTVDAETRVSTPAVLQDNIDKEIERFEGGRAFVRPSGTEDVVRIYAEAATQDEADTLAHAVATHVYKLAGGIGRKPD